MRSAKDEISPEMPSSFRLPIHFDVREGRIPVGDFQIALKSVDEIVRGLDERLGLYHCRDGQPAVYVEGVKDGSLKTILIVDGFLISPVTLPLAVAELTETTINIVESETFQGWYEGHYGEKYDPREAGRALGKMTKDILESRISKIDENTPDEINLDRCIKAKSNFYRVLSRNENIQAIGFDDTEEFPIRRQDFAFHISRTRKRKLSPREEFRQAIIAAPVTIHTDQKWRFIDRRTGKSFTAYMHDENFSHDFLDESRYPLKQTANDDEIIARFQVERMEVDGKLEEKNWNVVEVLAFNGQALEGKNLPTDQQLEAGRNIELDEVQPLLGELGGENEDNE